MAASRNQESTPLIIDRHISLHILRPFLMGLSLLIIVFVGFSAAVQLGAAAQGQLSMLTAFKLIALNTLITLEILLPSAFYFSVLAGIGGLYRDAEMNALYAAGVSRARILEAVLKLALVIALVTGFLSVQGRPWAFRTSYDLEAVAAAKFDLKKMATGEFVNMSGSDYTFIANDLDLEQGLHKGVFLHNNHAKGQRTEIIVAEAAALPVLNPGQSMQAEFFNGYNYLLDNRGKQDVTMAFDHLIIRFADEEAQDRYRRKAETTLQLAMSSEPKDIAEFQWRVTTPFATLLLALLAVPLARSAPRESRLRNFVIAVALYIGQFAMISVFRTAIEQGRIGEIPGLWGGYLLVLVLLVVLVRRQ